MAATYKLIGTYTTSGTGTTAITFSSIPQTYNDLVLRYSERSVSTAGQGGDPCLVINGSSSSLSGTRLVGNGTGSGATYANDGSGFLGDGQSGQYTYSGIYASGEIYIPGYTLARYKPYYNFIATENNQASSNVYLNTQSGTWASTSAITSIGINLNGGTGYFANACTFHLYGISNS